MFEVTEKEIRDILQAFGITAQPTATKELRRYRYEEEDPQSPYVRLILKVSFADRSPIVLRFKNEPDAPREVMERQAFFATLLNNNGVPTPQQFTTDGNYTLTYRKGDYEVLVAAEAFVEGELSYIDLSRIKMAGEFLARTHTIAEANDVHIPSPVLFDPFSENDLFSFETFLKLTRELKGADREHVIRIVERHTAYLSLLKPLLLEPTYAVQSDFSQENLYLTKDSRLGLMDFNRAGDNRLFCDAALQGLFLSRLMDYPEELSSKGSEAVLRETFWQGYTAVRPLTTTQKELLPYLEALVKAFWTIDLYWAEDSLKNAIEKGDKEGVQAHLRRIETTLNNI